MTSRDIRLSVLLGALAGAVQWWGLVPVFASIAALLFTVSTLLIVFQEKMLYIPVVMGYKTVADNPLGYRSPREHGFEYTDFYLKTADGETIHGWHIRSPVSVNNPIVIFCHENAGNVGLRVNNLVLMSQNLNCDVVAFDYRGYGDSSGRPSEAGLLLDTEAVYTHVAATLSGRPIFLYGRSLGGAVALQFAATATKPLAGVIAENTFTSIADMVGAMFHFLNFGFVKKHCLRLKWDNAHWIRSIEAPLLLIGGKKDEIVPFSHMERLAKICAQEGKTHEFHIVPLGTHNDTWILGGVAYWSKMKTFVQKNSD